MPFYAAAAAAVLLAGAGAYSCSKRDNGDRLSDTDVSAPRDVAVTGNATGVTADPAKRCASNRTYDLLKRELFRRAAQIRGTADVALFDRIATAAALRVERPLVTSQDEGLGSIACSASAAIDLPPGLAVAGGRTSLSADLAFTLQPAADGSGDVLAFTNADAIVVPLATIGRKAGSIDQLNPANPTFDGPEEIPPTSAVPRPSPPPVAVDRPASPPPAPLAPRPEPRPSASTNPSFNCANARTRGEIAVCGNPGLAALDRQMAAQFRAAYSAGGPEERSILDRTRSRFLGFRDNCPTDACMAGGYRDRMREIDDIMRVER